MGCDHEYWLGESYSLEKSAIQVVPEFYVAVEGSGDELEWVVRVQKHRRDLGGMSPIGARRRAAKGRDGQGRNNMTCGRGMYFYGRSYDGKEISGAER